MAAPFGKRPGTLIRQESPFNAGPPPDRLRASFVTPVEDFFVRNHGGVPEVDAASFRLTVGGEPTFEPDNVIDGNRDTLWIAEKFHGTRNEAAYKAVNTTHFNQSCFPSMVYLHNPPGYVGLRFVEWFLGGNMLDGVTFAPRNGMTLICGMFHSFGTSNYGNARYPGLVYITGFLNSFWGDLNARGSIIMMGDFVSLADVTITYDPLMLDRMPDYMEEEWPDRVSGSSRIITWREVSAPTGG